MKMKKEIKEKQTNLEGEAESKRRKKNGKRDMHGREGKKERRTGCSPRTPFDLLL